VLRVILTLILNFAVRVLLMPNLVGTKVLGLRSA
jgi:hypothetical protein